MAEMSNRETTHSFLGAYVDRVARADREAFCAELMVPVLISEDRRKRPSFSQGTTKFAQVQTDRILPSRIVADKEKAQVLEIRKRAPAENRRVILGRSEECDLVIPDDAVSMLHSIFIMDEATGRCTIEDMDSKNGTLLNGEAIQFGEPTTLNDGDTLAIGELRFLFYYPAGLYDLLSEKPG